MHIFAFRTL